MLKKLLLIGCLSLLFKTINAQNTGLSIRLNGTSYPIEKGISLSSYKDTSNALPQKYSIVNDDPGFEMKEALLISGKRAKLMMQIVGDTLQINRFLVNANEGDRLVITGYKKNSKAQLISNIPILK